MQEEQGFRLIVNRGLLDQVGGIQVDFLSGPFRKGFSVKAQSQGAGCSPNGCSTDDCAPGGCSC